MLKENNRCNRYAMETVTNRCIYQLFLLHQKDGTTVAIGVSMATQSYNRCNTSMTTS